MPRILTYWYRQLRLLNVIPDTGVVGVAYSFTPDVVGGDDPRTFALTGTLPTGLSFNSSTGEITGTPTAAAMFAGLEYTIEDASEQTVVIPFHINISTAESLGTEITQFGITWSIAEDDVVVGNFVSLKDGELGDPWVVAGPTGTVTITHISPSWVGTGLDARHGSMVNPANPAVHGFDGRTIAANVQFGYSDAVNVALSVPFTLSPDDSLISCISKDPEQTVPPASGGGSGFIINTMAVLTCLATAPAAGTFRPTYVAHTGAKPLWTQADVNYLLLPGLAVPTGPTAGRVPYDHDGDVAGSNRKRSLKHPWIDCWHSTHVSKRIRPGLQMYPYPADTAREISRLACYVLLDLPDAEEKADRLIQLGIDLDGVRKQANHEGFSQANGFWHGRAFPIIFAGLMLNDLSMQNVADATVLYAGAETLPRFGEERMFYSHTGAHTGHLLPKRTEDYLSGPPLYGDARTTGIGGSHDARLIALQDAGDVVDARIPTNNNYGTTGAPITEWPYPAPNATMDNAGRYMLNCRVVFGAVLAAHILGIEDKFNSQAFLDFCDRWAYDDNMWGTYGEFAGGIGQSHRRDAEGFGGTTLSGDGLAGGDSRDFMMNMWYTYRDTKPVLTSPSGTSTGATTADLKVTTDLGEGYLHYVVTLTATTPKPWQVVGGRNSAGALGVHGVPRRVWVTATGVQTIPVTGLTGVPHYVHWCQVTPRAGFSDVVSSTAFTPTA